MVSGALTHTRWPRVILALASLLGCEERSPFSVSSARHPEYYDTAPAVHPESDRERRADERSAPSDLPELPGETVEVAAADSNGPGQPLDIRAALLSGALRIDANDPSLSDRLEPLFDGDTRSLARTEDVNPLILVFRLSAPIRLAAVRIFPSYSTYDWAVRPDPLASRLMTRDAPEELWSRIDLPAPIATTQVRLEVRRLLDDNVVLLNEVELLVAE